MIFFSAHCWAFPSKDFSHLIVTISCVNSARTCHVNNDKTAKADIEVLKIEQGVSQRREGSVKFMTVGRPG